MLDAEVCYILQRLFLKAISWDCNFSTFVAIVGKKGPITLSLCVFVCMSLYEAICSSEKYFISHWGLPYNKISVMICSFLQVKNALLMKSIHSSVR